VSPVVNGIVRSAWIYERPNEGKETTVVQRGKGRRPVEDLAAEAERARTPWTPLRALAGVWLAVAAVVAIVIAVIVVVLTLYA
jgi:hypothetical protein